MTVSEWERRPSEGELSEMLRQAEREGIYLRKVADSDPGASRNSWLGGPASTTSQYRVAVGLDVRRRV